MKRGSHRVRFARHDRGIKPRSTGTGTTGLCGARSFRVAAFLFSILFGATGSIRAQELFPRDTLLDAFRHRGTRYEHGGLGLGLGAALAAAGDVNADGFADLAIAAPGDGGEGGSVWIVLGGRSLPPRVRLADLGERAVRIRLASPQGGDPAAGRFGATLGGGGDLDGDGFDDLVVGIPGGFEPGFPGGAVAILFGARRLPAEVGPAELAGGRAVLIGTGRAGARLGAAAAFAGDLDGDGVHDLAIGLPGAGDGAGAVEILFGGAWLRGLAPLSDLDALPAERRVRFAAAAAGGGLGAALAGGADLDGDGAPDLVIGSPGAGSGGAVYVLFGGGDGSWRRADFAAPDGRVLVRLSGHTPEARFGAAVAAGGDADGDGTSDLLCGAPLASRNGFARTGIALWIPGGPQLRGSPELDAQAAASFAFEGGRGEEAGTAVAFVPDVSGDGLAELLVGAPGRDGGRGAVYLIYGGALAGTAFPADITPPFGARFFSGMDGARLGASVAGLEDREGDGRGEFAAGAPGALQAPGGSGVVYEVRAAEPGAAPRHLSAEALPERRVLLTWSVPHLPRFVTVYRDGTRIAGPLPGDLLRFVDREVPLGLHRYEIEADGDPALRSAPAAVTVRPLAVRGLRCSQIPGSTRVALEWRPGDTYGALRVETNGIPLSDLPPQATSFDFDLGPGRYRVEVYDPSTDPEGERAHCEVVVSEPPSGGPSGLACTVLDGRAVRLVWEPDGGFAFYLIRRGGVPVARTFDPEFVDFEPPPGRNVYGVSGVTADGHRSPEVSCAVEISPPAGSFVSGRVVFDDGVSTPIGAGVVEAVDAGGNPVARGQPDAGGLFQIPVPEGRSVRLIYRARIESVAFARSRGLEGGVEAEIAAGPVPALPGRAVEIRVPPPVLAVSSAAVPEAHWSALASRLSRRTVFVPILLPEGAGRGAVVLREVLRALSTHFAREFGRAPRRWDIVAYGRAGIAVRLLVDAAPEALARRLVLLGTPNLGTARAIAESRGENASRPFPGSLEPRDAAYRAAREQTAVFLERFNRVVSRVRGAEVHLVAGAAGDPALSAVLGCVEHDGRVCAESVFGGVPGAFRHKLSERHAELGRSVRSVTVLAEEIGLGRVSDPVPLGVRAEPRAAGQGGGGGGLEAPESGGYTLGRIYSGRIEPGSETALPLFSDTSGSIIIILGLKEPQGIEFSVTTPEGDAVDPFTAALHGAEFVSLTDGEGQALQAYRFDSAAAGTYTADIANPPENPPLDYTLEIHLESELRLYAAFDPASVEPGGTSRLTARIEPAGASPGALEVSARIERPDGTIETVVLTDDGQGADETAGDGVYSTGIAAGEEPGPLLAEVLARTPAQSFERTAPAELEVLSDAAVLRGPWSSGLTDTDGDGRAESLWVEGAIEAFRGGPFFVTARLETTGGEFVATGSTVFALETAGVRTFRLIFDGEDIAARKADGPYAVREVRVFDAAAGFVEADRLEDVHETEPYGWAEFDVVPEPRFVRGDANADGRVDISDATFTLLVLFTGEAHASCIAALDANADGAIDVSDPIHLLGFLFLGAPEPPAPFPECGRDGPLPCTEFAACP